MHNTVRALYLCALFRASVCFECICFHSCAEQAGSHSNNKRRCAVFSFASPSIAEADNSSFSSPISLCSSHPFSPLSTSKPMPLAFRSNLVVVSTHALNKMDPIQTKTPYHVVFSFAFPSRAEAHNSSVSLLLYLLYRLFACSHLSFSPSILAFCFPVSCLVFLCRISALLHPSVRNVCWLPVCALR